MIRLFLVALAIVGAATTANAQQRLPAARRMPLSDSIPAPSVGVEHVASLPLPESPIPDVKGATVPTQVTLRCLLLEVSESGLTDAKIDLGLKPVADEIGPEDAKRIMSLVDKNRCGRILAEPTMVTFLDMRASYKSVHEIPEPKVSLRAPRERIMAEQRSAVGPAGQRSPIPREVGTTLEIIPKALPEGGMLLSIDCEYSVPRQLQSRGENRDAFFAIDARSIQCMVGIKPGRVGVLSAPAVERVAVTGKETYQTLLFVTPELTDPAK